MTKIIGLPAIGCAMLTVVGITSASGLSDYGEYKSRVPEGRLFINNGRMLRCDLFFSSPGMETVVAPKGSELDQSVPPVVWQYSGLLPVKDYLRTAAIHSVSSDAKSRSWQDVQHTFYSGLRVEGASELDAKIAYAGAYAFAPRWPLVEFTVVEEQEPLYPETILYSVEYNQPAMKGMSLDGYRRLALAILEKPNDISLEDIRVVIDAADNTKAMTNELGSLGGIGGSNAGLKVEMPGQAATVPSGSVTTSGNSTLRHSENLMVSKSDDDSLPKMAEKIAEPEAISTIPEMAIPEMAIPAIVEPEVVHSETAQSEAETGAADIFESDEWSEEVAVLGGEAKATEPDGSDVVAESDTSLALSVSDLPMAQLQSAEIVKVPSHALFYDDAVSHDSDNMLKDQNNEFATEEMVTEVAEVVDGETALLTAVTSEQLDDLEGPADDWIILSDGTMVLRSITKLVSE